jgi:methylmalonyl-CoA mutase
VSPVDAESLDQARARWRRAVVGVLAKSNRRDPAELPPEPERLLDTPTYEGFPIRPLYTALDALPEAPLPGDWPFVRGAERGRDVLAGWKVAVEFPGPGFAGSAAEGNIAVLDALTEGVSALVLRVGDTGIAPRDLDRWLVGVYLDLAPVILDAGADFQPAAEVLVRLVAGAADTVAAALSIDLGADPLTARFGARPAPAVDDVIAVAAASNGRPGVRAITVDGPVFHDLGAGADWELAAVLAAATDYLRLLTGAGIGVTDALGQISFRLAASDDQFMTIAKFRAARRLWARVAQALGHPGGGALRLHAVTSAAMMTQRDPWVNMLRATIAAFGAGVGGADTVTVLPFDSAIPGGYPGVTADFARRIARNTQLLLLEESHIGRVLDPAGGSWFVEDLTETLAAQAWSHFREIESRGGFRQAGDYVTAAIERTRTHRSDDIAHRRTVITGVSAFPNVAEPPLPPSGETSEVMRYAAPFEQLRDRADVYRVRTGRHPQVLLLPLGPLAENNIRATFAANLLACGGIEAVNPGTVGPAGVGDAVRQAGVAVAVICGADARYGAEVAAVVPAARAAGIEHIYLAGPEEALADVPSEARPDGYLTDKIDAVQSLSELLNRLGA